jgi:hypothetical protein
MWSLNLLHSDRQRAPDISDSRTKVVPPHFYSFHCWPVHLGLYRCSEFGTDEPLILIDISGFISILNVLKSL